jgi:hypothetical protein
MYSFFFKAHAMGNNGDAKQEMLTNKVLTKWVVGIGVISLIIWSVLIALIMGTTLEIDFGLVGFTIIWVSFVSTMACMCGLIEAKTQHLISNTKMIYALIENVLDEKEMDESFFALFHFVTLHVHLSNRNANGQPRVSSQFEIEKIN